MAFSTQRAVSDGTMVLLGVSIGYIKQADIAVFYNDLPADDATWNWVGSTPVIAFTPAVPAGVRVLLKRTTQIDKVINRFTAGAGFTNKSMDTDFLQMLYLNQEAVEGAALTDIFNNVDFHGYRPTNIGTAVNPNDAVSLGQYQADAAGASASKVTAVAAAAAALVSQTAAAASAAAALASQTASAASASSATASQSAAGSSASVATTGASTATTQAAAAAASAAAAAISAADAASSAGSLQPVEVQTFAAAAKSTPVDADVLPLVDSAASNGLKKLSWANLKATLKAYFDTLYPSFGAIQAQTYTYFTTAGSSTVYTLTPTPALTALAAGQRFSVAFDETNTTTTPTLVISGLTAKNIKLLSNFGAKVNPLVGQIPAGSGFDILYDGTDYILTGIQGYAAGDVLQVASFASDAGGSSTAGTVANVSASSKTITPKSTNSILVVMCTFQGTEALLAGTNTTGTFQLLESGSVIGGQYTIGVASGSGNNRSETAAAITARLANSALTARSFTLGAATSNAGAAASAIVQMFTITEIQAP